MMNRIPPEHENIALILHHVRHLVLEASLLHNQETREYVQEQLFQARAVRETLGQATVVNFYTALLDLVMDDTAYDTKG